MSTSMIASESANVTPISASTSPSSSSVAEGKKFTTSMTNLTPTSGNNSVVTRNKEEGKDAPMGGPELLALIIEMRLGTNKNNKSKSSGAITDPGTMDLSHRKIRNLPNEMVEIIKDDIVRLAVGYNFLTVLPSNFVELSKLRYLNIRANLLSSVPAVLCSLPSLEILDMSRNKVRQLPSEPGRLAELRVLSISNNRLRKLPGWLANVRHLRILKLEGNPINWPPPHVSVMPPMDKAAVNEGEEGSRDKTKSQMTKSRLEDKHMMLWISKLKEWIAENEAKVESQDVNNEEEASTLSPTTPIEIKTAEIIPANEAEEVNSSITPVEPQSESLPSESIKEPEQVISEPSDQPEDLPTMPTQQQTAEEVVNPKPASPIVSAKEISEPLPNATINNPSTPPLNNAKWNGSGSSRPNETISATPPASVIGSSGNRWQAQGSTTVAAIESERNSYFKRLSTLPASTISTRVSVPVLLFVDATRGVLYALSQMHTALRQYVAFATDERMTSHLSRVLDIAGKSMASLIQSLDRFDSLSRTKGDTLDPLVIRGVVISCLESIATFRKLIHVVQLQLRSLQRGADIRYTRTLLILLYGSLAEISNSWKTMEPLLDDVEPYLSMGMNSTSSSNHFLQQPALPSIAEATSPITPTSARMTAPPSRPQRRRHAGSFSAQDVAHGASMSSGDFSLPPNAIPPLPSGEDMKRFQRPPPLTAVPEPAKLPYALEQGTLDGQIMGTPVDQPKQSQSQPNSQILPSHKPISRRTLSNTSGPKSAGTALYASQQPEAEREVPIDDHLLQLVVRITSVAFSVWAGIEEYLITLGLPAASGGHSIKSSNGGISSLDIAATSGDASVGTIQVRTITPNTPSRSARALRQQVSEASTLPETPDQNTSRSTDPDTTLIDSNTPQSATTQSKANGNVNDDAKGHHQQQSSLGTSNMPTSSSSAPPSPAVQRRLRQLHDLTRGVNEHTHRLHGCLERAQDAIYRRTPTPLSSPPLNTVVVGNNANVRQHIRNGSTVSSANSLSTPSNPSSIIRPFGGGTEGQVENGGINLSADSIMTKTSRELFVESNHFIKSILQISHFIKALSAEGFILPKYVKASMAELTTCARDLTLHLHFLSGPPSHSIGVASNVLSSAPAAISNGTISQQQQQQQQQQQEQAQQ